MDEEREGKNKYQKNSGSLQPKAGCASVSIKHLHCIERKLLKIFAEKSNFSNQVVCRVDFIVVMWPPMGLLSCR